MPWLRNPSSLSISTWRPLGTPSNPTPRWDNYAGGIGAGIIHIIDIDFPVPVPKTIYVDPPMQSGLSDLTHWYTPTTNVEIPDLLVYCKIDTDETPIRTPWTPIQYLRARDEFATRSGYLSQLRFDNTGGINDKAILGRAFFENQEFTRYGDTTFTLRVVNPRFVAYSTATPVYPEPALTQDMLVSGY